VYLATIYLLRQGVKQKIAGIGSGLAGDRQVRTGIKDSVRRLEGVKEGEKKRGAVSFSEKERGKRG